MNDDFNIDDFLNLEDDDGLRQQMQSFQDKMKSEAMNEAYRFICEVGILFWIRKDMYVKNSRKLRILNNMITYFIDIEEYENCAYLQKGVEVLEDLQSETIS